MSNGTARITPERDYMYAIDKLRKAVKQCDNTTLEFIMASIRGNEKALCKGEITDTKWAEQQKTVTDLIVDFSWNCECSNKSKLNKSSRKLQTKIA